MPVKSRKEKRQERVKNGFCRDHANRKAAPGKTTCQECIDYTNNRKRKIRARGNCPLHPQVKTAAGLAKCQECVDKNKLLRAERIKNKVCVNHPDRPVQNNNKKCIQCVESNVWSGVYKKYGLTKEQYFLECEKRDYKCDLCKKICQPRMSGAKQKDVFHIDHNHKTGKIRGFLCSTCNLVIGKFNEDVERIIKFSKKLIKYLQTKND